MRHNIIISMVVVVAEVAGRTCVRVVAGAEITTLTESDATEGGRRGRAGSMRLPLL